MVVLSGPVLGAIMDYSALKKRFLFFSYLLTIIATSLLYFVEPGFIILGVTLIIISNFAYAIGENFRSEEHTTELQSRGHLVCRLLLEKKNSIDKHE